MISYLRGISTYIASGRRLGGGQEQQQEGQEGPVVDVWATDRDARCEIFMHACSDLLISSNRIVPSTLTRLVTLTGALRAQPAIAPCGPAAPQVTASCSVRLCPVVCTISKPRAVRRRRRVRGYGVHNYRETASELCAYLWFYTRVQDPWIFVINCKQFSEVRAIRSTEQYYSTVVSPLALLLRKFSTHTS